MPRKNNACLFPILIALLFAANACAGKRVNTEPNPPEKQEDPIKLEVSPRLVVASPFFATIKLTVTVDPHPENSYVEWSWDSPTGESGSSGRSIDGNSQKKFPVFIRLSIGKYQIRAILTRGARTFTAGTEVNVLGEPVFDEQWER